jgi:hypothetical protein
MERIKILTIKKEIILTLIQFASLIGVAMIAPLLKQQIITGSLVNATLFIATILFGIKGAILVGFLPSLISLSVGLLPLPLMPMTPFIIIGNAIMIITFNYLKERNYWLGIIVASSLKFIFLLSFSVIIFDLFLSEKIFTAIMTMMSWPQLLTALLGGLLAYIFSKKIISR